MSCSAARRGGESRGGGERGRLGITVGWSKKSVLRRGISHTNEDEGKESPDRKIRRKNDLEPGTSPQLKRAKQREEKLGAQKSSEGGEKGKRR